MVISDKGAVSEVPSVNVPDAVREEYTMTARRLLDVGILIDADIPSLESAFVLLADARYYHELMERVKQNLDELDDQESVDKAMKMLVSATSMHIKSLTLFSSIISNFGVTPNARAKILHALPKKKDDPNKKSIKSVLARKK